MNLLDPDNHWLLLRRLDGSALPASVHALSQPDVVDVLAPRADFRGALYQLLIGLLQTAHAPADMDDWHRLWRQPPDAATLQAWLAPLRSAFELDGNGAAFMQDLDPLTEAKDNSTADLLIDRGSDSNLFFNKPGSWQGLCPACVAQALFTLQINAPGGGVGHRTSLRGGGPLSTLVLPANAEATLWQKLWLNVLPQETGDEAWRQPAPLAASLPWLTATRVSDKNGVETRPDDVHPLQAYWSMPRRLRLDETQTQAGQCGICGQPHEQLYTRYRTRNYGTNYTGNWLHPLTPYAIDPKHVKPALPAKGGRAAGSYQHWLSLTFGEDDSMKVAAVVSDFNRRDGKADCLCERGEARLWCFGFEMDNMKARAWHDSTLPLYQPVSHDERRFAQAVRQVLGVAEQSASLLGEQVKLACGSSKKEPAVEQSFWQHTETSFYAAVQQLASLPQLEDEHCVPAFTQWLKAVRSQTLNLFDRWILNAPVEEMNMKRVIKARDELRRGLWRAKPHKQMEQMIKQFSGEAHEAVSQ